MLDLAEYVNMSALSSDSACSILGCMAENGSIICLIGVLEQGSKDGSC